MATLTLAHQPEAVEGLERRLRDEILTANLSKRPVISADERFMVQRVLGHGASSVVCRALEIKLERAIALKLFPGLADDALARAVKREALALAKISHANIVTIHDFGVLKLLPGEHCCFFVAMELGVPLKDWLRETSPAPESVLATFCRIGEGLAAIHAAGFVYRDFKPENVVLVAGVPKIVDFGLALTGVTGSDGAGTRRHAGLHVARGPARPPSRSTKRPILVRGRPVEVAVRRATVRWAQPGPRHARPAAPTQSDDAGVGATGAPSGPGSGARAALPRHGRATRGPTSKGRTRT